MAQSSPRRLTFSFILIWFVIESAPSLVHLHIQFTFTFTTDWTQDTQGKSRGRSNSELRSSRGSRCLGSSWSSRGWVKSNGHLSAVSGTRESECFEARMLWFRNWDCLQSPWSDLDDQQLALLEVMLDRFLINMSASAGRLMFPICFRRCPVCQLEFCRSTNPRHHIAPCFRPAHHQGRCLCDEHLDSLS